MRGCGRSSKKDSSPKAKWIADQLLMFGPETCEASSSAISSPGLEAGLTLSGWRSGPKIEKPGPGAVLVSRFRALENKKAMPTSDTCGPLFIGSSPSAILQSCLASRLRARLDVNGSPEYELTWKDWDMPAGVPVCVVTALRRRKKDSARIGLPSPQAMDSKGYSDALKHKFRRTGHLKHWTHGTALAIHSSSGKSSWPEPAFAAWLMGFPLSWLSALRSAVSGMRLSRPSLRNSSERQSNQSK